MEYQKIINLLNKTPNQPAKFKTKNQVKINDQSEGTYKENNQTRFKTSMLRSSLFDCRDAYIIVKGTITIANTAAEGAANNGTSKKVIFKNCVPFTNCISRINNTQVDDAHDIHVVMPMYNLVEYIDNYSKISEILLQYCRDEQALDNNNAIADFTVSNSITDSFKIKEKITGQTGDNGI